MARETNPRIASSAVEEDVLALEEDVAPDAIGKKIISCQLKALRHWSIWRSFAPSRSLAMDR